MTSNPTLSNHRKLTVEAVAASVLYNVTLLSHIFLLIRYNYMYQYCSIISVVLQTKLINRAVKCESDNRSWKRMQYSILLSHLVRLTLHFKLLRAYYILSRRPFVLWKCIKEDWNPLPFKSELNKKRWPIKTISKHFLSSSKS